MHIDIIAYIYAPIQFIVPLKKNKPFLPDQNLKIKKLNLTRALGNMLKIL